MLNFCQRNGDNLGWCQYHENFRVSPQCHPPTRKEGLAVKGWWTMIPVMRPYFLGGIAGVQWDSHESSWFSTNKKKYDDLDQRTFPKTPWKFSLTHQPVPGCKKRTNLWSERNPISFIRKDGDFLWSILVYQRVSVVTFDITPFRGGGSWSTNFLEPHLKMVPFSVIQIQIS